MLEIITVRDDTAWTCLDIRFGLLKEISFTFHSWKCDFYWFFCYRTLKELYSMLFLCEEKNITGLKYYKWPIKYILMLALEIKYVDRPISGYAERSSRWESRRRRSKGINNFCITCQHGYSHYLVNILMN